MKIFETNSALGYNEVAYFIQCNEGYLCIFENQDRNSFWKSYKVGELAEFEHQELTEVISEKHKMVLDESPLKDTFLFNQFLKGLK